MKQIVVKILYKLTPWLADADPERFNDYLLYARRVGYAKKRGYPAQCANLTFN